jgi:hypothetical protein
MARGFSGMMSPVPAAAFGLPKGIIGRYPSLGVKRSSLMAIADLLA